MMKISMDTPEKVSRVLFLKYNPDNFIEDIKSKEPKIEGNFRTHLKFFLLIFDFKVYLRILIIILYFIFN